MPTTQPIPNARLSAPSRSVNRGEEKSARPQPTHPQTSSSMKQKILIVDDEPDALELIKVNLTNAGFTVATAEDGEEAIKKARAILPGLILLDLMLPEVDGLEVCKILRPDGATKSIPII